MTLLRFLHRHFSQPLYPKINDQTKNENKRHYPKFSTPQKLRLRLNDDHKFYQANTCRDQAQQSEDVVFYHVVRLSFQ